MKNSYCFFSFNHQLFSGINFLITSTLIFFFAGITKGQIKANQYTFSISPGTYTDISGTGTYIGTGDDVAWYPLPIGFTFTYDCNDFTTFGVTTNGFLRLGAKPPSNSDGVNYQFAAGSTATDSNTIGGLSADLYNMYSGLGKIWYQTTGSPGSRVCTVEWQHMYFWGASADYSDDANFQIQLFEGTNVINIVYGYAFESGHYTRYPQVGIRGDSNNDYNLIDDAGGTLQWNAVTATTTGGNTLSKTWGISNTNEPATGLTYVWTPPSTSCVTTSVFNVKRHNPSINMYPNPVGSNATLQYYSNDESPITVNIVDILGRTINSCTMSNVKIGENNFSINTSGLIPGIYFLHATGTQKVFDLKFSKL